MLRVEPFGVGAGEEQQHIGIVRYSAQEPSVSLSLLDAAQVADDRTGVLPADERSARLCALLGSGNFDRRRGAYQHFLQGRRAVEAMKFAPSQLTVEEHARVRVPTAIAAVFGVEDALLLKPDETAARAFAIFQAVALVGYAGQEMALKNITEIRHLRLMSMNDVKGAAGQGALDEVPRGGPLDEEQSRRDGELQPLNAIVQRFVQRLGDDGDAIAAVQGDLNIGHGDFGDGAHVADRFENHAERGSGVAHAGTILPADLRG